MSDTPTKLFGPSNPGTATSGTLYTAPAGGVVVRSLHAMNGGSGAKKVSLGIDGSALTAAKQFVNDLSIAAKATWDWNGFLFLPSGVTIRASQETSGDIIIFGWGVEFSTGFEAGAALMAGPVQPGVTTGTVYTAPANGAIVRCVHVANTDSVTRWVSLGIDGSAAFNTNNFLYQLPVAANSAYDFSGFWVVPGGKTLDMMQETATACTVLISGVEL